jgi:hypothetical protein
MSESEPRDERLVRLDSRLPQLWEENMVYVLGVIEGLRFAQNDPQALSIGNGLPPNRGRSVATNPPAMSAWER